MKKLLILLAAALPFVFSCQQELAAPDTVPEAVEAAQQTIHFFAEAEPGTRTAFGDKDGTHYPTLWTANDTRVQVSYRAIKDGEVAQNQSKYATVSPSMDYKNAEFSVSFNPLPAMDSVVYYLLSPNSAHGTFTPASTTSTMTVKTGQTPLAGSPDEGAQILAGKSARFTTAPSSVSFSLNHVTAYGRISILNLDCGTESVESIVLTAEDNWVGTYTYDYNSKCLSESSASKILTLTTSSLSDVWFTCAPVDLGNKTIDVAVNTDGGVYRKTITIPSGKKFTAGKVAAFNIDMDGILKEGSKVYSLVTDVTDLTADSEVIIVAKDNAVAVGALSGTYMSEAAVTKVGSNINNPSSDVVVFTTVAGTESNSLSFKTEDDKYLASKSNSSNDVGLDDTKTANSSWSISITDSGVATIKALGSYTRNWFSNYHASTRFSCYAGNQNDIMIYKLVDSGNSTVLVREVCATPSISCVDNEVTISCATSDVDIYYTTDESTPTTSSTPYSGAFDIASSCTVKAIAVRSGYIDSAVGSQACVYGATASLILSSDVKFGTSSGSTLTDDKSIVWTMTSLSGDAQNSYASAYHGQKFGINATPWSGSFSASFTSKTVSSVSIDANTASAATVSVTVGGDSFLCNSNSSASIVSNSTANAATWYDFVGSGTGSIVITVSSTSKAFYFGGVRVTYSE